ncbi:hypothetical protein [Cesiribacter sp. SM1]|uniref:hypothetical protein n=1 Tax=Cesiribacter sp. SM1 TaxID=2861196 RepID=UPI001CD65E72|nr:hypothetical protein [Cesiribacter sp. SM1]
MNKLYKTFAALFFGMVLFASCEKEPTEDLTNIIKEDLGYLPVIASFTLKSPATTTVQPGTQATFDLRYWSEGALSKVEFWMIQGENETLLTEQAYVPAYSTLSRTDSLIFNYTVPANLQPGAAFSIQSRVYNEGLEEYPVSSSVALTVAR